MVSPGFDILRMGLLVGLVLLLAGPLGIYVARVFQRERTFLDPVLAPVERAVYRVGRIDPDEEMEWREYALSLLIFNALGFLVLFTLELAQGILPLNPQRLGAVSPLVAFNAAVSFTTNTNWQAYAGEKTMTYLTQIGGLTVQNFVSAGTGIAVAIALIRGITRKKSAGIGNFWFDLTRSVLWVLLPLSVVLAVFLASQGVVQNLAPYGEVTTLEGAKQTIATGSVASQEAIKQLGTNGGGFFNANSAHPFENPTPVTNLLETLAILLIPAAMPFAFGRMAGDARQGYVIVGAMVLLFLLGLGLTYAGEYQGNPRIAAQSVASPTAMEGKEVRFGIAESALWGSATTAASNGSVNSMLDSFTPFGGLVAILNIMLGEVVFGGVGAGLYGMLVFVLVTVFVVGLMVGRTPEYLGKKVESWEMKMAVLAILIPSAAILIGSAVAVLSPAGRAPVLNLGPHGLSEILYAFSSGAGNNGSAFAGLDASAPFYAVGVGIAMLVGRFGVILPVLAIAGSLAAKKVVPVGAGTFQTRGLLFTLLLAGVVLIVGALTFFPALALGPLVEQLLMSAGRAF